MRHQAGTKVLVVVLLLAAAACQPVQRATTAVGPTPNTTGALLAPRSEARPATPTSRSSATNSTRAAGPTAASDVAGTSAESPGTLTLYGRTEGLLEPLVAVSVDEGQAVWAVSHIALYVLRPGSTRFRRYTDADGLHIGKAAQPGIMTVAGGRTGEGFVGYNGFDIDDVQNDMRRSAGKMDHISLRDDGTLEIEHVDMHNDDFVEGSASEGGITASDFSFHEDRGARRMLYDHTYHPGTLYIGWNHGVGRMDWGHPDPKTGLPYADHIHPTVALLNGTPAMGEWRALALDPVARRGVDGRVRPPGELFMGGEYTAGAIDWTPSLYAWSRNEENPVTLTFERPPVFAVAADGDPVNIRAIAITHDGTVFFASGPHWDRRNDPMRGIARWDGTEFGYIDPVEIGLPTRAILDMVDLPDDTLAFAMEDGLFRWDPRTNLTLRVRGLPSGPVASLYLDTLVSPAAVYVTTGAGLAVVQESWTSPDQAAIRAAALATTEPQTIAQKASALGVSLEQRVSTTPADPGAGEAMEARFQVRNTGARPVTVEYFLVGVRDPAGANVDFPPSTPVTLQPGETFLYAQARALPEPGAYILWPALYNGTAWIELAPRTVLQVK